MSDSLDRAEGRTGRRIDLVGYVDRKSAGAALDFSGAAHANVTAYAHAAVDTLWGQGGKMNAEAAIGLRGKW